MKNHTNCRVCGEKLIPYLDLGMMPLSNNLMSFQDEQPEKFPLEVMFCPSCYLSQLSVVIESDKLFSHYVYRSSMSETYKEHCRNMATSLKGKLSSDSFHIDIAGNDGALLYEFKKIIGGRVLNVDPAENLASICEAKGIETISKFWSEAVANEIVEKYGHADLITATNVFAHVDKVYEFMKAAKQTIKPDGVIVLEFPYLVDFIENKEFDTIYFEHLSYFSIVPLWRLCGYLGLEIKHVEKQSIHGGSIRVTIGRGWQELTRVHVQSIVDFEMKEDKYNTIEPYLEFAKEIKKVINNFKENILSLNGTVAGFAASAKGNILLNSVGITYKEIKYIVDQTPEKIGKYSPGTGIPIVDISELTLNPPDYLVILSWNFAEEIMSKCIDAGYEGKFIIPIPEFKILYTPLPLMSVN